MAAPPLTDADLGDIQGLVLSGWIDLPCAAYVFARIADPDAARRWLAAMSERVTSCRKAERPATHRLHVAIARTGLDALGLDVRGLSQEAKDGMNDRRRALGDDLDAAWELGDAGQRLDVLLLVYGDTRARVDALIDEVWDAAALREEAREHSELLPGHREHFGFVDGISQPFVAGAPRTPKPGQDVVPAGEFLLGHENAYGRLPVSPRRADTGADFGKNGSYLVFRKIEQDVAGFWRYFADQAAALAPGDPDEAARLARFLAAKAVGRWPGGAPLVLAPDAEIELPAERLNDFRYLELDPDGERCPVASHVRRANPRDARGGSAADSHKVVSRHRILRRGRPYGSPVSRDDALAGRAAPEPRGLYFLSLQASIARGFEFVQQTWLANPGFRGLHREADPLSGAEFFTIPMRPFRLRLRALPSFLHTRGGGYFLLPSRSGLRALAEPLTRAAKNPATPS